MNALAAVPGWRGLAIWVMPPVAYALASDTLIGMVRAWTIARHNALRRPLAAGEAQMTNTNLPADRLAFSVDEADQMRTGKTRYLKVGRRRIITRQNLEAFLADETR